MRGGGTCPNCGKATYAVDRPDLTPHGRMTEADRDELEAHPYCGWCGEKLIGVRLRVLADEEEAKPATEGPGHFAVGPRR